MTNDLISVIIPCYNQAQYLEEAVLSVIEQTYPNVEIIIVNDESLDNTQEVADRLQVKYPEKIQVVFQKNSGVSTARNNGISQARGKYILPLDADDKLDKEMLTKCFFSMKEHQADIVYTGYQGFGLSNRSNLWIPFEKTNPLYITPCSVTSLFKKEVWNKTRGYKTNMHIGYEDWEFWINAYKHHFKFQHLSEKLFFYRIKDESRDTNAYQNDAYIKSKIIMNHPELYPIFRVRRSIDIIHDFEQLADIYFYYPTELLLDSKIDEQVKKSLMNCTLYRDNTTISIQDSDFDFIELDDLHDIQDLELTLKKFQNKPILFYSLKICYKVPKLKICKFSLSLLGELIMTKGSVFPYTFTAVREDQYLQSIACQYMEKFEALNQERVRTLQQHNTELKDINNDYFSIIKNLDQLKLKYFWKNPLKIIQNYKKLLYTYELYRETKFTIQENKNNIIFSIEQRKKNTQIAFYLYKNDIKVDIQWYSKDFFYLLGKKKFGTGKYTVKYFIVYNNIGDPGNARKLDIGYVNYTVI